MKEANKVKKRFEEWLKKPKIKIDEVPRKGDLIIQLFVEKKHSKLFTQGSLIGGTRKYELQPYPYAVVLKVNEEEEDYKEGDVIYLSDNILLSKKNDAWDSWNEKEINQKPTPHEPEPPKMIGGIEEISLFRFKRNKFTKESEEIDEELYQIPIRIVKGRYK